jgi:hypothetical protein
VTRPLVFMPAARLEAIEAQDWFEREAQGLGARFRTELDQISFSLAIVDGDSPGASLQRNAARASH